MVANAVPRTSRFSNWARPSFLSLKKRGCHDRFSLHPKRHAAQLPALGWKSSCRENTRQPTVKVVNVQRRQMTSRKV